MTDALELGVQLLEQDLAPSDELGPCRSAVFQVLLMQFFYVFQGFLNPTQMPSPGRGGAADANRAITQQPLQQIIVVSLMNPCATLHILDV